MRARRSEPLDIDVREIPAVVGRFIRRNNVLYPLSALLMLVGCYLISMPYLFEYRELDGLMALLGVINVYEAMLIAAFAFITRRAPDSREAPTLLFVELLFLLDATFTVNACITLRLGWGLLISVASLALAVAKMYALEQGSGRPVFGGVRVVLLPAMLFTYTFQSVFAFFRGAGAAARESSSYFVWLVFGLLLLSILLARFGSGDVDEDTEPGDDRPTWLGPGLRKAVVAVALVLAGAQLVGQAWVHVPVTGAPFRLSFLLPLAFSVVALIPKAASEKDQRERDRLRIAAAGLAVFLSLVAYDDMPWAAPLLGQRLAFSPTRIGLVFGAAVFLLVWRRERSGAFFDTALVFLGLAVLGHSGHSVTRDLFDPHPVKVAAVAALAAALFLRGRAYRRALVGMTPVLFMTCMAAARPGVDVDPLVEFFRWWPLAAFILTLGYGPHLRAVRIVLTGVVALVGVWGLGSWSGAGGLLPVIYFWVAAVPLVALAFLDTRAYALVLACYLVAGALRRHEDALPRTPVGWGVLTIGFAFAAFAGAFLVTRLRLERPEAAEVAEAEGGAGAGGGEDEGTSDERSEAREPSSQEPRRTDN